MTRKQKIGSLIRSSAAEYLTFVAASGTGSIEAAYADENVWLSQTLMAQLYDVDVRTINYHLKTIFSDSELEEPAVLRNFRITAADGTSYELNCFPAAGRAVLQDAGKVTTEIATAHPAPSRSVHVFSDWRLSRVFSREDFLRN